MIPNLTRQPAASRTICLLACLPACQFGQWRVDAAPIYPLAACPKPL